MKILYITDLHGSQWKYDQSLLLAKEHQVQIVINGGDMYPKGGDLFEQDKFITGYLKGYFERFNAAGIHYLSYPGNDDLKIFDDLFEAICKPLPFIQSMAQRKIEIEGYEFIGMNWVVDYPFRLKDRCRMDMQDYVFQQQFGTGLLSTRDGWKELDDWCAYAKTLPTIADELEKLPTPENFRKSIYILHMPPARLGLDKCANGTEVGSKAIYQFIEKSQPLLTLHGHIHESPRMTGLWHNKIGQTVCIQPGQLNEISYVLIELPDLKYERFELEQL